MPADTPGVILELSRNRARIETSAGHIWIDQNRLLPAQRALEEVDEQ